ncbi:MAG: hypothetical protein ACJ8H8_19820 [Geminicoccaceae bacterium]
MPTRTRSKAPAPAPAVEVIPTVRPLGTAARVAAALSLDPTMSETDANIVALATELVTLRREYARLTGRVEKLERAVTVLLKLSALTRA